jgi:hypothetical protein
MKRLLLATALLIGTATAAQADTVRLALLVGNNVGTGARRPLRYAEGDAHKLGDVLNELGGFRRENVHVLTGQSLAQVDRKLGELAAQVRAWRERNDRVVLLFYFSGHSDGQALELGTDRWPYQTVRERLKSLGAEIRIAIVDSCQSGALLAQKGGVPGPAFDIRFNNDLANSGEAVLTSSAADELALESREIRASFFSHHLISGLRGAADSSGDGRITLAEAYRHAFVNTLLATSGTLSGPQHPGYDYRMSGQGELVLTEVVARGATLTLPSGFDQLLIADEVHRHLVAELTRRSANRLALPPGRYVVQGRRDGRAYEMRLSLGPTEARTVRREELLPGSTAMASAKGDDLELAEGAPRRSRLVAGAEGGVLRGAADALPWIGAIGLSVRTGGASGLVAGLELGTGRASAVEMSSGSRTGFRETTARLALGAFTGAGWKRLRGELGWRLTGGTITQSLDGDSSFWSWTVGTGPWLSGGVAITESITGVVTVGLDGALLRRDGRNEMFLSPHAGAGVRLAF